MGHGVVDPAQQAAVPAAVEVDAPLALVAVIGGISARRRDGRRAVARISRALRDARRPGGHGLVPEAVAIDVADALVDDAGAAAVLRRDLLVERNARAGGGVQVAIRRRDVQGPDEPVAVRHARRAVEDERLALVLATAGGDRRLPAAAGREVVLEGTDDDLRDAVLTARPVRPDDVARLRCPAEVAVGLRLRIVEIVQRGLRLAGGAAEDVGLALIDVAAGAARCARHARRGDVLTRRGGGEVVYAVAVDVAEVADVPAQPAGERRRDVDSHHAGAGLRLGMLDRVQDRARPPAHRPDPPDGRHAADRMAVGGDPDVADTVAIEVAGARHAICEAPVLLWIEGVDPACVIWRGR